MNIHYLNTLKIVAIIIPLTWMAPSKAVPVTFDSNIEIVFPDMIILYGYSNITLNLTQAGLTSLLQSSVCTTGGCGIGVGKRAIGADSLGGTIDLRIGSHSTTGDFSGSSTLVLADSWGVRGIGGSGYKTSITGFTKGDGVTAADIETLTTAPTLALQTGDVTLTLDHAAIDKVISTSYTINVVIEP